MTGPYKPTKIVVDNSVELEPFKDHWSGIPPIAKITMKFVADPNARILALQSGDTDMLYNFPAGVHQDIRAGHRSVRDAFRARGAD